MTLQQVIALIQQWIVQNGNEEITADVLRPILEEMVQQPNDLIGDLSELTTANQDNLVEAINEINANTGAGVVIHFGSGLPTDTPPTEFSLGDFYAQMDGSAVETFWQFNGSDWVLIIEKKGIKTISTTPYTLLVEDLNRPLIFTSNNQVVNIEDTLVESAAAAGLTLYDFIAHFQGTGTHTVNYPDSQTWTGSQGALVYALCIDMSGDTEWVVKEWAERFYYDPVNKIYVFGYNEDDQRDLKSTIDVRNITDYEGGETVLTITTNKTWDTPSENKGNKTELRLNRGRGTHEVPEALLEGDGIGEVVFAGYRGDRWYNAARIEAEAAGDFSLSSTPTRMMFRTVPIGSTSTIVRMLIENNGNISIGNENPINLLTVGNSISPSDIRNIFCLSDEYIRPDDNNAFNGALIEPRLNFTFNSTRLLRGSKVRLIAAINGHDASTLIGQEASVQVTNQGVDVDSAKVGSIILSHILPHWVNHVYSVDTFVGQKIRSKRINTGASNVSIDNRVGLWLENLADQPEENNDVDIYVGGYRGENSYLVPEDLGKWVLLSLVDKPSKFIGELYLDKIKAPSGQEYNVTVDDTGRLISEPKPDLQGVTLLSQHTESQTTGDTGANLLQPDTGAAIFTTEDMQAGNSYSGDVYLQIDNNDTATAKVIELFGIELFNATSAIPDINGRLTFDIDFYNQDGDNIDYRITFGFDSSGLQFYDSKENTIDNTVSADIEFTVDGHSTDNLSVKHAKIQRC